MYVVESNNFNLKNEKKSPSSLTEQKRSRHG